MLTTDARCAREIKSRIGIVKAGFNKCKLDLNFREKLLKCYIWSTVIDGSITCTFRKVENKDLRNFEM
jgi:hypothetical protein